MFSLSTMNDNEFNMNEELPFDNVSNSEMLELFGSRTERINEMIDLYDLFSNPDKNDDSDPDLMLSSPCSKYFSVPKINEIHNKFGNKSFFVPLLFKKSSKKCACTGRAPLLIRP